MTRWIPGLCLGLLMTGLLPAPPLCAQQPSTDDLKKEIQELKEGQKAIQKDLQDIKTLLQGRAAAAAPVPVNVVLDLGNAPAQGERTAKLTLIEFSDYQCPFCGRHFRQTAPQLDKEYIETGKVRHVFLDFPLESMHESAFKAAEAARCAGDQGKYWQMHQRLFENQSSLEPWTAHATALGLDAAAFETCLNSSKYAADVRKDMAEAKKVGVTGTPAFFLAYTDPKSSKVTTLASLIGAQPFASFKAEIDRLLAAQPKPSEGTR